MCFKYIKLMFNFMLPYYILLCCFWNVVQAGRFRVLKPLWGNIGTSPHKHLTSEHFPSPPAHTPIPTYNLIKKGTDCNIVSKISWDGLNPSHVEYLPRPVDLVIIQHSATGTCTTDGACEELVRNIQTNHMENLNYWDIGPNFLIGGNGKVYEGSGWVHVGAHTRGYNRKSIGISFLGHFNSMQPSQAALNAAQELIQCGVDQGHLKPNYNLVGHKQLIATESPGRKLFSEIRMWPNWLEDVYSIKNN